jgi:predicted aspartyl protease
VITRLSIQNESVVVPAAVNGSPVTFVIDTGDALGPTFTAADAARLGLRQGQPVGIEGAGGATTVYETVATIAFDGATYASEPCFIDTALTGESLLGLPFFLKKCQFLGFAFSGDFLIMG